MRTRKIVSQSLMALWLLLACAVINTANAQTAASPGAQAQPTPARPTVILPKDEAPASVAKRTDLYCAGFIQYVPFPTPALQIIGAEQEQERRAYSQGDYVYINAGERQGVKVGDTFSVVRPRGKLTSKFTRKHGYLGVYVRELGQLRVLEVKERVSVAVVETSCEVMLTGDLIQPSPQRLAPTARPELALDRFADPSGKQTGRIVLARDSREMVSRNQVVFIDLGAEDSIKAGDYFTVYRPVGKGNITTFENEEIAPSQAGGFESDRYAGGKYSSISQRTKDYPNTPGLYINKEAVTSYEIKRHRPRVPRKVVGELVILSVQTRTATAIITRVAQEVHTGDYVELQ
ncbi:MAG TPA: FlgT C-terminal domain-containing protein [Pyrinomonadaceae bacterium]